MESILSLPSFSIMELILGIISNGIIILTTPGFRINF